MADGMTWRFENFGCHASSDLEAAFIRLLTTAI
jgi:hypothetical protein